MGNIYSKNVGTGDYENPQTVTADSFALYGCISKNAEFIAVGGESQYRILKLNSGTNQYDQINDYDFGTSVRNC